MRPQHCRDDIRPDGRAVLLMLLAAALLYGMFTAGGALAQGAAAPAGGAPTQTDAQTELSGSASATTATDARPTTAVAPEGPVEASSPVASPSAAEPPPAAVAPPAPDLSPLGMFRNADLIVQAVILGLIFASLVTWTIWLAKTVEIMGARMRVRTTLRTLRDAVSMDEASNRAGRGGGPAIAMVRAARHEVALSAPAADKGDGAGLKERVASVLDEIAARAGRRATVGTGILATIGATAPFVGLFGTVWGIMNAFIGIAEAQSSSLAVVAPGIAEALLATALGLVAAIPAVIIYNACARWIAGYRHSLSEVAACIERLVSRDLDFSRLEAPHGPTSLRAAE